MKLDDAPGLGRWWVIVWPIAGLARPAGTASSVCFAKQSMARLAGYEDVNDADRLGRDPAMRCIVGGKGFERGGASTSEVGRFETELVGH